MKTSSPRSRRGSALVAVLVIGFALLIICGALLRNALTERRLNSRTALRLQTYALAEAVAESAIAQVRQRIEARPDFSPSRFVSGGEAPVPMPVPSFATVSGAPAFDVHAGAIRQVSNAAAVTFAAPVGINSNFFYYDPADPSNQFDPQKGRWVFRYDLPVYAKAAVPAPVGQPGAPETVCVKEILSIRSVPIFAYAVFYNMDLEMNPGPQMDILGNVHANGALWVRKDSHDATTMAFHGQVTVTGGFYEAFKVAPLSNSGVPETLSGLTSDTQFTQSLAHGVVPDALSGVYDATNRFWRDHKWGQPTETPATMQSFRDWATATFVGNLQTSAHGVQVVKLPAMGTYVEDPTPNDGVDNSVNEAHQLIEPPLLPNSPGYNADLEAQKYATQSGIYLVVNPSATARTGHTPDGFAITVPARQYRVYAKSGNSIDEIILPGQQTYGAGGLANQTPNAAGPAIVTIRLAEMVDLRRATFNWTQSRSAANPYAPRMLDTIDLDLTALKLAVDKSINGLASTSVYSLATPPNGTAATSAAWTNFIYNVSGTPAARALTTAQQIFYAPAAGVTTAVPYAGTGWNGGIYVESVDAPLRKDSGVRLINGRGRVASDAAGNGLTVATNDALYIFGHYNADGAINTATTGTTNSGRYPEAGETPCSFAADAITILTQPEFVRNATTGAIAQNYGWNDALSLDRMDNNTGSTTTWRTTPPSSGNVDEGDVTPMQPWITPYDRTSGGTGAGTERTFKFPGANTEISAAFLTGLVPSNKDGNGQYSGGLNNYPRFLERHAGIVAIRGSLVALFESRVATEPWTIRYYAPPTRLWGFNELFNQGKFPPLTPRLLSFRRASFSEIPPAHYDQAVQSGL
jgi:hypothetical protein